MHPHNVKNGFKPKYPQIQKNTDVITGPIKKNIPLVVEVETLVWSQRGFASATLAPCHKKFFISLAPQ